MSLLIETYLNFESRDSLVDHLTSSYAEAMIQDEVALFLSAAYTRWVRTFPQDCLDGFQPEKYHGKRAPHPVYPVNGSPATCGFPEVVRATLKSVCRVCFYSIFGNASANNFCQTSHRIVDSMFEFVHEGTLLNQEQRLINVNLTSSFCSGFFFLIKLTVYRTIFGEIGPYCRAFPQAYRAIDLAGRV